jgi:hypothetical protein
MTRTPTPLPAALLTTVLALSLTSGCDSSGSKAQSRMTVPQGNEAVVTSTGLPYRPTAPVYTVDPPAGFRPELNPPTPLSSVPGVQPTPLLLASPLRPYREPKAPNDWVTAAKGWRGTPFREGGADRQGADSAGYVVQLHKEVSASALAKTPTELWTSGKPVGIAAFEPGDIGNHWKFAQPGQWIRALGKRIIKLDIKGFSRPAGKFTNIGDAQDDIPWADVRAALREINYHGWCAAEVSGGTLEDLKAVSAGMNRVLELG